jgi:hypothetical protein
MTCLSGFVKIRRHRLFLIAFAIVAHTCLEAKAAPIVAGSATQTYINIQQIRLFPGTPFNPGTEAVEFELFARGTLTAAWDAQVGNTMQHSVPHVDFEGVFPGNIPFHIYAGTPDLPPTTGQFSNVVQNSADPGFAAGDPSSLVSANYTNTAYFKQVLPDGTTIYSDQVNPATFTATLSGLPYPVGQQFISTGALNLYVQLGPTIDQANDFLIGQSLHRVVEVVPEPTALTLLSLGAVCLYVARRGRTRV